MKKLYISIIVLIFCYSCVRSELVYLMHPATGDIVECGGKLRSKTAHDMENTRMSTRYCVDDYKDQGYKRIAEDKIKGIE